MADTPRCSIDTHSVAPSCYESQRSKPSRRRARRACLACRARKVRCDVEEREPCGNCKWDNTECVVVNRRCGRYARANSIPRAAQDSKDGGKAQLDLELEGLEPDERSIKSSELAVAQTPPTEHYGINEDLSYTAQMLHLLAGYTGDYVALSRPDVLTSAEQSEAASPLSTHQKDNYAPVLKQLPRYIRKLPTNIVGDDLAYLSSKGTFEIPAADLQNALIWSFFEHVYPFMPILDIDQFLQSINVQDGSNPISLLLFQAVLFAGTAHVEMSYLKRAGFQTRRDARKAFFQKVRLLYDFNTECDSLALIPAVLLMSLWYETPEEHRNTWHWIDVAISQAFAAGLHRTEVTAAAPAAVTRTQKLGRRVWWVCFMRDRLISLGMKRPPRIRDDDYDLPMLDDADFEPYVWQPGNSVLSRATCSYNQDHSKRLSLAKLCVAKVQLCRCLRYYLRSRYSVFVENAGHEKSEVPRLSNSEDKAAFLACNEDLVTWYSGLSDDCKYRSLSVEIAEGIDRSIALSRTILHMTYFAALSGIHRSRFALLLYSQGAPLFEQEVSKLCMQHAALQVSDMAEEINKHGLDGSLPTIGLGVVISAAAVHLLEVKGVIQAGKTRALEGYRRCMRTIDSLTDMYVAADLAKDAIRGAFASFSDTSPLATEKATPSLHVRPSFPPSRSYREESGSRQEIPTPGETVSSTCFSADRAALLNLESPMDNNSSESSVDEVEMEWLQTLATPAGDMEGMGDCFLFDNMEAYESVGSRGGVDNSDIRKENHVKLCTPLIKHRGI